MILPNENAVGSAGVTGKEMCETIVRADFLRKPDGTSPNWKEIWNYSSTGELYWVFVWYAQAKLILATK